MARTRCHNCLKKSSYTRNGNSKRTHETGKTTSSIDKETTTATDNKDSTGREKIQISHIRLFSNLRYKKCQDEWSELNHDNE